MSMAGGRRQKSEIRSQNALAGVAATLLSVVWLLISVICAGGAALAHGDAEWIMRNPLTAPCCGPTDCAMLPDSAVTETADGWIVVRAGVAPQRFDRSMPNVYPSRDGHYWGCAHAPDQELRCFFYPPPGV
jgi:hypothetical protein